MIAGSAWLYGLLRGWAGDGCAVETARAERASDVALLYSAVVPPEGRDLKDLITQRHLSDLPLSPDTLLEYRCHISSANGSSSCLWLSDMAWVQVTTRLHGLPAGKGVGARAMLRAKQ